MDEVEYSLVELTMSKGVSNVKLSDQCIAAIRAQSVSASARGSRSVGSRFAPVRGAGVGPVPASGARWSACRVRSGSPGIALGPSARRRRRLCAGLRSRVQLALSSRSACMFVWAPLFGVLLVCALAGLGALLGFFAGGGGAASGAAWERANPAWVAVWRASQ